MTIGNELLSESLKAMREAPLAKSLKFRKTGKEIKQGIARKIAECEAKIAVFKAVPPDVKGKHTTEQPEGTGTNANPNQWRIDSLQRRIKNYETVSRNLKDGQTYDLDRYELTEYGL